MKHLHPTTGRRVLLAAIACLGLATSVRAQAVNEETLEPLPPTTGPAVVQPKSPSLAHVDDNPTLPRVLLIGDSISMGYTLRTRERLKGVANVHRPSTNCGPTSKALSAIDAWLTTDNTSGQAKPWDVIHFNFGLHDLKYVDAKGRTVTPAAGHQNVMPEQYEKNLKTLIKKMKATGATLIWASTTPIQPGMPGHLVAEVDRYNQIAVSVMKEEGIATDDLYTLVKPRLTELQLDANVHFRGIGCDVLADGVADAVKQALQSREAKPKTTP